MNPSAISATEPSLLMWAVGLVVAMAGAHAVLGWIRHAQREPGWRTSWGSVLVAAATLGTVICAVMVLTLAAEGLPFRFGYRAVAAVGLWLGAIVLSLPVVALLVARQGWLAVLVGGLLMAALSVAVQGGWIWAVGFRPGVVWSVKAFATAAVVMTLGFALALRLAYPAPGDLPRPRLWQASGSALLGVALIGGQEFIRASALLTAQLGSVYVREIPAVAMSLIAGVAVPAGIAVMLLDLHMHNRLQRRKRRALRRSNREAATGGSLATPGAAASGSQPSAAGQPQRDPQT